MTGPGKGHGYDSGHRDGSPERTAPRTVWLDLTRKCQLNCVHCYNASGPDGRHGTMSRADWMRVLEQCAHLGVTGVQLIGGEPTLHPDAAALVRHALDLGLTVEVYSNLVHVTAEWWDLFHRDGVSVATSYYSDDPAEHQKITGRATHRVTRTNIMKAVGRGIRLRVGIVAFNATQRVSQARRDLKAIGVTTIRVDRARPFGRAAHGQDPDVSQLCGRCGTGKAAISPTGEVSPCVFSAWLAVGNVHDADLGAILGGAKMVEANALIRAATGSGGCDPDEECSPGTPASVSDTLPGSQLQALIRPHTGELIEMAPTSRGNNSAITALVDCENGSFFLKAVPNRPGGRRDSLVREGLINPFVVPISPAVHWQAEDAEWIALGFEIIEGRPSDFTPSSGDLPAIIDLLDRIGELEVPSVARGWPETRWDRFAADDAGAALLQGEALLYTDINPSNLVIGNRATWAVDWSWPTRGAAFIDPACLIVQLIAAGHTAEAAEAWAARCGAWASADPIGIDAFAAANLRMYRHLADRRPGQGWLKAMGAATAAWADHRGVNVPD